MACTLRRLDETSTGKPCSARHVTYASTMGWDLPNTVFSSGKSTPRLGDSGSSVDDEAS